MSGPAYKIDCQAASLKICQLVLGRNADYQLGTTKVFLKDADDLRLEQERDKMLHRRATVIQKTMRGWLQRRRYQRMRSAAIVIQKKWRAFAQRNRYKMVTIIPYFAALVV